MNTKIALSWKCKYTMEPFLTLGWHKTWRAWCFMWTRRVHTRTHRIIVCPWVFVSYWQTGNDDRPHVINGHNYVMRSGLDLAANSTRCPLSLPAETLVVLMAYSGVSGGTKTQLSPAQFSRPSFLSLVNKDLMVYKPSNNHNTFRAN